MFIFSHIRKEETLLLAKTQKTIFSIKLHTLFICSAETLAQ